MTLADGVAHIFTDFKGSMQSFQTVQPKFRVLFIRKADNE
jgi:hypothetical protein